MGGGGDSAYLEYVRRAGAPEKQSTENRKPSSAKIVSGFLLSFSHLKPQATAVMPTRECEVITGMSLSRPIMRGLSSSANCHEFLP